MQKEFVTYAADEMFLPLGERDKETYQLEEEKDWARDKDKEPCLGGLSELCKE